MKVSGALTLEQDGKELLGGKRIALLRTIGELGSITQAARAIGMSYRAAWEAVEVLNNLAPTPLVARVAGGPGGGGAWLTEAGKSLLAKVRAMQTEHARLLAAMNQIFAEDGETYNLLRRIDMKLSARNQWYGKICGLIPGAVNTVVEMELRGGDRLTAVITRDSAEALALALGVEVLALTKASSVIIATDLAEARLSARNRLAGKVSRLVEGPVSCDITLELSGGNLVSATITRAAAAELGLKVGMSACAIIKASSIIIGVS